MKENKMGTMPINKLLITMSLPIMISMLVQAMYNIVDSIFVSRINENALTAVSYAFPIQALMIAIGTGTGVGVSAILSRSLGEKNYEKANKIAENGIFLAAFSYVLFLVIGLFCLPIFYASQTDNKEIYQYGIEYLRICCVMSFGCFFQIITERLLQATGRTIYTMITQGLGAIINIILDPIMIFGLFGCPKMGVSGAALATVTGQILAAILGIVMNARLNHEIHIKWKGFRPDLQLIKSIYAIGLPSIFMQAVGSFMVYCMNLILVTFSSTAVAVFGIYFKLQSFIFMPIFGLNNGMVPIIAYNFGAGKRKRVIQTIRMSVILAVSIMLIGLLVFYVATAELLYAFNASANMMQIGIPALRIISLSFTFAGFCIVCGSVFQAFGRGVYSLLVSVARQLVLLLPSAYLLSKLGNVDFVWWSYPIAEIGALVFSLYFLRKLYREVIVKIGTEI